MHARCANPDHVSYPHYGACGIRVCQRWNEFKNFIADMGERPFGTSLDRIDNDGDYQPSNCRWTTYQEQARNKRATVLIEHAGERRCLKEWCERLGLNYRNVHKRIRRGTPATSIFG